MELNLPGFNALLGLVHIVESGPDPLFKTRNRGPSGGCGQMGNVMCPSVIRGVG